MALSRLTNWIAGQILTRNALVGEFDNIYNNALSLISPLTGNLNANLKSLTNLLFETQAATQSAGNEGRVYYQTTEDQIHVDDGSNVRRVPTIASVTRGDIIRATASGQWARLALGTSGHALISDGTDVGYAAPFRVKAVTFTRDMTVAPGTQAVTGVGFTPKAAVFIARHGGTFFGSWGVDDGTTAASIYGDSGTSTTALSTTNSINMYTSSGNEYHGKISAFGADGFTITWTETGTATGTATVLAFVVS